MYFDRKESSLSCRARDTPGKIQICSVWGTARKPRAYSAGLGPWWCRISSKRRTRSGSWWKKTLRGEPAPWLAPQKCPLPISPTLPYENTIRKGGNYSIRWSRIPIHSHIWFQKCGSRTAREWKISCESRMVIKKGKGALHERQTDGDGMECRKTKQKKRRHESRGKQHEDFEFLKLRLPIPPEK